MPEHQFEQRLDELFAEYASQGVRRFDRHAIARATIASSPPPRVLLPALSRRAQLAFAALLLLAGVGATLALTGRLAVQPLLLDGPSGVIVLTPDTDTGRILAIRPNGTVLGEAQGSTNGCDRLVLTADGRRVAWVFQDLPLTVASLDGSERKTLLLDEFERTSWAFSPDRTRFAFVRMVRNPADPDVRQASLVVVSLLDGSETVIAPDLRALSTPRARLGSLRWSTTDLLAIGIRTGAEIGVDVIAADGTGHRVLAREPLQGPEGAAVSWSPDGSRLAYAGTVGGTPQDGWVVDLGTGRSAPVMRADGLPVSLWTVFANTPIVRWDADGRHVIYRAETSYAVLDLLTGESRLIPSEPWPTGGAPFWSPDGSRLAFWSIGGPPARLTTMNADLSVRVDQTLDVEVREVAWAPDGRWIAVRSGTSMLLVDPAGATAPLTISGAIPPTPVGYCLTWWAVDGT